MPRPPKSIDQHKSEGTFRADRHAGRLDTLPAHGLPVMPARFTATEKEVWDRVLAQWKGTDIVGEIDTAELTACCEMWGLYRQAVSVAKDCPTDKEARCAVVAYLEQFNKLAAKFGMTWGDRASMKGAKETKPVIATRPRIMA